ncbi:MAG: error-prone DNA polymerase [Bdellovibrio sp.]|nr:error-prone DNA polymerase [Bdellovibrio sp.]
MYVELKCKTNFSFLRGASSAGDYIDQCVELTMPAIAINDVNGVYALPRAFEAIKKQNNKVKLICSSEVTIEDHPPITLIAQTRKAYGLMCRTLTQVHAGKEKGEGKISLSEMMYLFENFAGSNELICLPDLSEKTNLSLLKEMFPDKLYLPLCRYLDGLDQERTEKTLKAAKDFNLPIVATNNVHYHIQTRRPLQDCLTCIREGVTMETAGFHLFGNSERYLKSDKEMRKLFQDLPAAICATEEIAEMCTFDLSEIKYSYPHEFIPPGHTPKSYLKELVYNGANERYRGPISKPVFDQIQRELDFFEKRGDEHYFLTVHDIVRFANSANIICQGRGSAANSIVCYILGITSVDPIQMKLLFDRFMNDGRKEPPDIDVDFEHNRREEVIQYIYKRFGRERAAMVCAVRTYRSRSAFIELSKAVGIDVGTISAAELDQNFDELAKEKKDRRFFVEELTKDLKKFPRHLSIHSGGFVLSDDPLVEIVPIEPARMPGRTIVQWDKDDLETLGLMKIDVLSIGFLTALHKATDAVGIDWRDIPDDDPKTYTMIQKGETHGTFQIESRAQMNMLVQTLPRNYYDLVVQVALVRPSPTVGGMVQPFIRGLHQARAGNPPKLYGNKKLQNILGRTYGVPIFQEQIMQISIDIAGFTSAEADQLRRSLSQQRTADAVDTAGEKLRTALLSQGLPPEFGNNLFEYIKGYAHYGFPESHAASYASLAYKSAYMKANHPAALVLGLINSQPMGFYPPDTIINEAKRNGVRFLPIDPNISDWDLKLEGDLNTVRMGFRNLQRVREEQVTQMIEQRNIRKFDSVEDFIFRTEFSRDVLENLSIANVFQTFGLDRRHSYWQSLEFRNLCQKKEKDQMSLFNETSHFEQQPGLFSQMSLLEEIQADYRKTGYSLEGNLMKALRIQLPHLPSLTSMQIRKIPKDKMVRYAGILTVMQRPPPAKGTVFITFEDEHGSIDTVCKKEVYEKYESIFRSSKFFIIEGKVQKKGQGTTLLITHAESFSENKMAKPLSPGPSPRALGRIEWD